MNSNKLKNFNYRKFFYNLLIGKTPMRKTFMFYIYAILFGIIFISLPISFKNPGQAILSDGTIRPYTFIDTLFISISAFTDTGLTSLNILGTYNTFGQIIILFLIQLGGLGLFTLYWIIWNAIFNSFFYKKIKNIPIKDEQKIGFSKMMMVDSERGNSKLGLSMKSVKTAIIFIFCVEIIFAIIYSSMFYSIVSYQQIDFLKSEYVNIDNVNSFKNILNNVWYVDDLKNTSHFYQNAGNAIWTGIFQSISTMNNAGFDIVGQASYANFRNGVWTIMLYISSIQVIIGGIGYPVIYDLISFVKYRYHRQKFRFSLFTKVTIITYFTVLIIGFAFTIGFEYGIAENSIVRILNANPELQKVYFGADPQTNPALYNWNLFSSLFYNVVSTRSNGASTISQETMSDATKWITIILMFIGCSPSSTGGGIRTTTLAIIFMTVVSYIRRFKTTTIFKKSIPNQTVINSAIIITFSFIIIVLFSLISYPMAIELDANASVLRITDIFFEFSSAYGTVGLTSGLSCVISNNDFRSYLILILLSITMVIGQLGVSTAIFAFKSKSTVKAITYPTEDLKI